MRLPLPLSRIALHVPAAWQSRSMSCLPRLTEALLVRSSRLSVLVAFLANLSRQHRVWEEGALGTRLPAA